MPAPFRRNEIILGGRALPQYLLYDAFSDTVAAGSVNGTLSKPPANVSLSGAAQARAIVDTGTRLSVGSGKVSTVAGAAIASDFYGNVTRVLGTVILATLNSDGNGVRLEYSSNSNFIKAIATLLTVRDGGGNSPTVGPTITQSVDYPCAMVLRAAGQYYFFKPTGGNWTLIWFSNHDNGTRAAGITFQANTVGTAANLRVPVPLYIPVPLAYDTFTRANGALGSTETTGPDGASQITPSLAWTSQAGTWAVASNAAGATALAGGLALATVNAPSADAVLDLAVTRSAGVAGIVARYVDSNNYLIAYTDSTNAKLDKVVAGVTTNLISGAVTYGAGKVLRLILSGTSAWLYYDAGTFTGVVAVGSVATIPASSATAHGLYTTDTTNVLDNFQAFARGTGNEFATLDTF